MGSGSKAQKVKGGNCAVIAVILLGGVTAAAVGVVEAIRHIA